MYTVRLGEINLAAFRGLQLLGININHKTGNTVRAVLRFLEMVPLRIWM